MFISSRESWYSYHLEIHIILRWYDIIDRLELVLDTMVSNYALITSSQYVYCWFFIFCYNGLDWAFSIDSILLREEVIVWKYLRQIFGFQIFGYFGNINTFKKPNIQIFGLARSNISFNYCSGHFRNAWRTSEKSKYLGKYLNVWKKQSFYSQYLLFLILIVCS